MRDVAELPPDYGLCRCGESARRGPAGWTCPKCRPAVEVAVELYAPTPIPKRARPGEAAEEALYAALEEAGICDLRYATFPRLGLVYQRGFPWGLYLHPRRGFQSDAAIPARDLLLEIDGGAHLAGRKKLRADTERRGLAAAAGWKILAVTPEQIPTGEAIRLIRAALEV